MRKDISYSWQGFMLLVRCAALLYGAVLACRSAINKALQTGCGNERERTLGIIYFCICGSIDLSCAVRAFSGRSAGKGLRAAVGNDRRRQPRQHTGFCHQLAARTVLYPLSGSFVVSHKAQQPCQGRSLVWQVRALVAAFKLDACCGRPHHARSGNSSRTLPLVHRHCGCGKNSPLYRGCADYLAVHLRMKNSGLKQAELNRIAVPTRAPISANRPAIM